MYSCVSIIIDTSCIKTHLFASTCVLVSVAKTLYEKILPEWKAITPLTINSWTGTSIVINALTIAHVAHVCSQNKNNTPIHCVFSSYWRDSSLQIERWRSEKHSPKHVQTHDDWSINIQSDEQRRRSEQTLSRYLYVLRNRYTFLLSNSAYMGRESPLFLLMRHCMMLDTWLTWHMCSFFSPSILSLCTLNISSGW